MTHGQMAKHLDAMINSLNSRNAKEKILNFLTDNKKFTSAEKNLAISVMCECGLNILGYSDAYVPQSIPRGAAIQVDKLRSFFNKDGQDRYVAIRVFPEPDGYRHGLYYIKLGDKMHIDDISTVRPDADSVLVDFLRSANMIQE